PEDGRRILIAADAAAAYEAMAPLFTAWVGDLEALYADYTDAELTTIADFMHRAAERQAAITAELVDDDD
ncbi:MAG: hypothetical protein Q7T73_17955, partial [Beijerinckiaceae bacterium]|nr:hypothetical protein [Beijerinckiaceae bacterium]